jgi:lipid II:glycine glycyltransferase (peptidoglycan interpeptide bridge formation enzyme)
MSIIIQPINHQAIWDQFILQQQPDTFLQSWAWGEFQTHPIRRLGAYEDGQLVGVALLILTKAKRGTFVLCPHGPVIVPERLDVIRALLEEAINIGKEIKASFVRVAPITLDLPRYGTPLAGLEFFRAPIHVHPELSWILDLSPDETTLLANMRKTTRYSIKKAEKDGVQVRISTDSADLKIFYDLYLATVSRQKFQPFSWNYLQREFELFSKHNMLKIGIAEEAGKPVSGAMIVFTPYEAFYHQGASITGSKSVASYLLQWRLIQMAKQAGCRKYNFWGISPEEKPNHPWAGLSLFKKGFGGSAHQYTPTADRALSWKYKINYWIEKQRAKKRGYN